MSRKRAKPHMWEWAGKVVEVPSADLAHSLLPSRHSKAPAELSAPNQHSPGASALVMLAEVHRPICYDSTVTPGMHPRRITQEVVFGPAGWGSCPRVAGRSRRPAGMWPVPATGRSSSKQQGTAYDPRASFFVLLLRL